MKKVRLNQPRGMMNTNAQPGFPSADVWELLRYREADIHFLSPSLSFKQQGVSCEGKDQVVMVAVLGWVVPSLAGSFIRYLYT